MTFPRFTLGAATLAAYVGTIVAANWAVVRFGVIPVGFGLVAPAGVLFAGLALTLRDAGQRAAGTMATLLAIVVGVAVAALVSSPALALASAAAFGASEIADMAIYTPLDRRGKWLAAVILSNTVGALVDSLIFLALAFGSMQYLSGQWVGKLWMTAPFVVALAVQRMVRRRRAA